MHSGSQAISRPTINANINNVVVKEDIQLTADFGNMLGTKAYQWISGGVDIAGATDSTFTPTQAEVGKTIQVRVTTTGVPGASNADIDPYTSTATAQTLNTQDVPTGAVTIDGTFVVGQTLTANTSTIADEDGLGPFSYQWAHSDTHGNMTNISGATNNTYVLQANDAGRKINVTVTYTDQPLNHPLTVSGTAGDVTNESFTSVSSGATRVKQQVGSVTTKGGETNVAGAAAPNIDDSGNGPASWNSHNTSVDIVVPVADDGSLVGGTIQPRIKVGNNAFENVGTAHTIQASEKGTDVTINVLEAAIEGATSYADSVVLSFNAVFVDAGSLSTGDNLTSTQTLTVDHTPPEVVSFALSDSALSQYETATVTLVFTEKVRNFSSADDISFDKSVGTLSNMTTADDGVTWTGTFTPLNSIRDTTNILTLTNTYIDTAGNTGVGNTTSTTDVTDNFEIDTRYPNNIDIPLILDMQGNATIFGEDVEADIVTNHIKLQMQATAAQRTKFINAFKNIYYTDAKSDAESGGVLFYKNFNNGDTGGLGAAIQDLLFDSNNIKHMGTSAAERYGTDAAGNSGIPIGSAQSDTTNHDGTGSSQANDFFSDPMIDNNGTLFHKILIRVACAHLMGHPFSQAFIQEQTVESDLKSCDLSGQVVSSFSLNSLNKVTTATGSSHDKNDGVTNSVLQTIFEQLLRVNKHTMTQRSDQDGIDDTNDNNGVLRELLFEQDNVVTFYIRPRLFFKVDSSLGGSAISNALGNSLATSDGGDGVDSNSANLTAADRLFNSIFSTNSSETAPEGYKWLAGRGTGTPELNQWQSNLTTADVQSELSSKQAQAMLDGHIWKIEVTL